MEKTQHRRDSKLEATDTGKYLLAIKGFVNAEVAAKASFEDIKKFVERTTARSVLGKEVDRSPAVSKSQGKEKEEFDRMSAIISSNNTPGDWRLLTEVYFQDALDELGASEEEKNQAA